MIHIFSGRPGVYLIGQWRGMEVPAMPVGINVPAQLEDHWENTGGACEYETIMNFIGTRTPITPEIVEFWDKFMNYTESVYGEGEWPIYTAFGMYDQIYGLKEAIEAAGSTDPDAIVPQLEALEMQALNGLFKYTADHDVYVNALGPTWPSPQYVRGMMCQWLAQRSEVVCPVDQPYSKRWAVPPWMYELTADLNYDGKVNIQDIFTVAQAFGTEVGDPRWNKEADTNGDNKVNIVDIFNVATDFGKEISLPLP
jgi:hypothetical protein